MERPIDIRLRRIRHAKDIALAKNPVDLPTIMELNMEEQRIIMGTPSKRLDPVTQAFVDTVVAQHRGQDIHGVSLFRPKQSKD